MNPTIDTAKAAARDIQSESGCTYSQALEQISHKAGFRDWNTYRAHLSTLNKFATSIFEFLRRHHLVGERRYVGTHTYEYTPVSTPELIQDLDRLGISYEKSRADNSEHPDCGKPILIFTIFGKQANCGPDPKKW